MFTAYVVVTVLAAATTAYCGLRRLHRRRVLEIMTNYGVPQSWIFLLSGAESGRRARLLVGIDIPLIGSAAAIGLIAYFVGAIVTVVRARWYSHIAYPVTFLLPSAASLALMLASS